MGLLRYYNIRKEDIDRIEVQLERPDSMGGIVIRVESVSIDGRNIDSDSENKISNKLVEDNKEFLKEYEVKDYISNILGISTDFIYILG